MIKNYFLNKKVKKRFQETKEPIKIFVACQRSHDLVVKVLEWSVQRTTTYPFKIYSMYKQEIPFEMPKDDKNKPGTPFSFQRFMIPEMCNFKGRAIYMDCDQILITDIARLFHRPMNGFDLMHCETGKRGTKKFAQRSSVMLIDCEKTKWKISDLVNDMNEGKITYQQLMIDMATENKGVIPYTWNSLDKYEPGKTDLIHYTAKKTQPWINHNHPDCPEIWFNYLYEALDAEYIDMGLIEEALDNGWVRPSMKYQVENRILNPKDLPQEIKDLDKDFLERAKKNNYNNMDGDYRAIMSWKDLSGTSIEKA